MMSSESAPNYAGWFIVAVVLVVYATSFFLPVIDAGTPQAMYGYQAFFWALVSVIYLPMWLSNPVVWIGCGYCVDGRWKAARNCGLVAVLLAISEVLFWDDPPEIGYYLWVASMVMLAVASAILTLRASFVERVQRE